MTTVYVPRDSSARSVGADQVAAAIELEAARRGATVEVVRNGSRGMLWLEPLIEVVTAQGRVAYGPVTTSDVADLSPRVSRTGMRTSSATDPPTRLPGSPSRTG